MNPIEFQQWLMANLPPGVTGWMLNGAGETVLVFEDGPTLVLQGSNKEIK